MNIYNKRIYVHELGHLFAYCLAENFNEDQVYSVVLPKVNVGDPEAGTHLCPHHEQLLTSGCQNYDFLIFDMIFSLGGVVAERHVFGTARGGYSDYARWKATLQRLICGNQQINDEDITANYEQHSKFLVEYFQEVKFRDCYLEITQVFDDERSLPFAEIKNYVKKTKIYKLLDSYLPNRKAFKDAKGLILK